MTVMANDVKTKGVTLFDTLLQQAQEVIINVRGKNRFVVLDIERYKNLRALELDKAYDEAMQEINEGKYKALSAEEHLQSVIHGLQDHTN